MKCVKRTSTFAESTSPSRTWRRLAILFAGAACNMAAPAFSQCQPTWSTLPHTGQATAFATYDDDGSGPAPPMLFVGGVTEIGVDRGLGSPTINVLNIARGDGWSFYPVADGIGSPIYSLAGVIGIASDQSPTLRGVYASDSTFWNYTKFRGIARWDGREWGDVGDGFALGYATEGVVFDEGPLGVNVIMGGAFSLKRVGNLRLGGVARWDGNAWSFLGEGLPHATGGDALAVFDEDGPGGEPPVLFVGDAFTTAGGIVAHNIARWNGQNWSAVGELGTNGFVQSLCVFDAGDGPMLYVGGSFSRVGGPSNWITAPRLARWDGKQWSAVPGWTAPGGGNVRAMAVFDDDGNGPNKPALFIAGFFAGAAGTNARGIIKWDGQTWDAMNGGLGGGLQPVGETLHVFDDDGDGPNPGGLYVGGGFDTAGGVWSLGLARWGCPLTPPCLADCDFSTGFGKLDVFDFLCFLNRFHAEAPYACDCDVSTGHGVCDIFDFLCYGQRFQAGCP